MLWLRNSGIAGMAISSFPALESLTARMRFGFSLSSVPAINVPPVNAEAFKNSLIHLSG
jgi:hypothetical protein